MNKQSIPHNHIADVRRLASHNDGQAIERCRQQALDTQANPCYQRKDNTEVMNVQARTGFVVGQMQQGLSLPEALRELGRRMRAMLGKN